MRPTGAILQKQGERSNRAGPTLQQGSQPTCVAVKPNGLPLSEGMESTSITNGDNTDKQRPLIFAHPDFPHKGNASIGVPVRPRHLSLLQIAHIHAARADRSMHYNNAIFLTIIDRPMLNASVDGRFTKHADCGIFVHRTARRYEWVGRSEWLDREPPSGCTAG